MDSLVRAERKNTRNRIGKKCVCEIVVQFEITFYMYIVSFVRSFPLHRFVIYSFRAYLIIFMEMFLLILCSFPLLSLHSYLYFDSVIDIVRIDSKISLLLLLSETEKRVQYTPCNVHTCILSTDGYWIPISFVWCLVFCVLFFTFAAKLYDRCITCYVLE